MKKLLFLFLFISNLIKAQTILQGFSSQSDENQLSTNIAYRHVGDSINRIVRINLTAGSLNSFTITSTIEPELGNTKYTYPNSTQFNYLQNSNQFTFTLSGAQIDSAIGLPTPQNPNNYNGFLDVGEFINISERSYVISCSTGDSSATSNQSLYSLSFGSQTALTQANTMVFTGNVLLKPRIFSDTFPGFCQDSVIRWEGAFINESNGVTNGTPFSQTAFHPTFYFRLAGQILDSLYLNGIKVNFLPIPGGCCNDYLYNLDSLCKWQNTTFGITNINADSFPEILPGDSLRFTLFTTISRCYSPMPENTDFTVGVS